jgi:hypothetical protein
MLAGDCVLLAEQRGGKMLFFGSPSLQIQPNRASKFKSELRKRLRGRRGTPAR